MPRTRFDTALAVVLRHEGGFSDHPDDPGGVTFKGISLRFLRMLRLDPNNDGVIDRRDIVHLTDDQVRDLYREHFWTVLRCGALPAGVDLIVFDCAVNQGPGAAAMILQRAAGARPDGLVGPKTLAAVAMRTPDALVREIAARRALRYARNPKIIVFGLGWFRRLIDIFAAAEAAARIIPVH